MKKLSTELLKSMISEWLSKPEYREDLKHHSEIDDPNQLVNDWTQGNRMIPRIQWECKLWRAPDTVQTSEQLEAYIWSLWCDGSRWKREEKHKLKDEWESYFAENDWDNKPVGWKHGDPLPTKPHFPFDVIGDSNEELVKRFHDDPKEAAKCIFRCFIPDNQLADNYRLEVVTTPDDSEVVGWTVIVD